MIRLVLILAALATPAMAETARVLSGEHGDFTRLVIELPGKAGWRMGRTEQGYAFAVEGPEQPEFDLTGIWQRIDRTRLAAAAQDPASGRLDLQLGCVCHIFPFEYQPGVVVLDIRPGAAPAGSVFEAEFAPPSPPPGPIAAMDISVAGRGGYDWLADGPQSKPEADLAALPLPLETGPVSLRPLRDALLEELALGAAEGVVDMSLPGRTAPTATAPESAEPLPWAALRIGEAPGIAVLDPEAVADASRPMATCTPDALVDLAAWGEGKPALALLAEARTGLFGEFDAPDPDAVLRSVRQLLYLGFGAEALQQAAFLTDGTAEDELAVYRSVARIIDLGSDPGTPFAAMLDCEGAAALWAALARDRLPFGPGVNRDAILRAFQALPPHLRRYLGPALAEKFLALADADAARMIRQAIARAPDADGATVALMDASAKLQGGDTAGAVLDAEDAVSLAGGDAASLVTLVEASFQELRPVDPGVAVALQALQGETRGTDTGRSVERALVLALALSGQTSAAFGEAAATGPTLGDLWRVAAERASDDDFLRHAVLPEGSASPDTAPEVRVGIAQRLLKLGFPEAALTWIGPAGTGDDDQRRRLAAEAELLRGDARRAVSLLEALSGPKADALRAEALLRLGDLPAAKAALVAAGDPETASRLALWDTDWSEPAPDAPAPWQQAAVQAAPAAIPDAGGLLTRSAALAAQGGDARAAIETLLAAVPSPVAD